MIIRLAKIALVASVALLFTLVVVNNLTDYYSNFDFVQHVMRMDTTFPDTRARWRTITAPVLHHIFYGIIIGWEAAAALLCWAGAVQDGRKRTAPAAAFNQAKDLAIGRPRVAGRIVPGRVGEHW